MIFILDVQHGHVVFFLLLVMLLFKYIAQFIRVMISIVFYS